MNDRDRAQEELQAKRRLHLMDAHDWALEGAIRVLGAELLGINVKFRGSDWLATVKADFDGTTMIAFSGAETWAGCILKLTREAKGNRLKWRVDKWAQ